MSVSGSEGDFTLEASASHPQEPAPKRRLRPPAERAQTLTTLPPQRLKSGIETFAGWREFFTDSPVSPISAMLARDWDHYSVRMFETVRIAWQEQREFAQACGKQP